MLLFHLGQETKNKFFEHQILMKPSAVLPPQCIFHSAFSVGCSEQRSNEDHGPIVVVNSSNDVS